MSQIPTVQVLYEAALKSGAAEKVWLPYAASPAFLCCLGAGPWKYNRRRDIQHKALISLKGRDVGELSPDDVIFPLKWQNDMLRSMIVFLQQGRGPRVGAMPSLVSELRSMDPFEARQAFYRAAGQPRGTKVLSLYLRDYVGIPCFPVDRHVRRTLEIVGLPADEHALIDICRRANVDPIVVARFLGTKDLNGGNPDWTAWPDRAAPEKSA